MTEVELEQALHIHDTFPRVNVSGGAVWKSQQRELDELILWNKGTIEVQMSIEGISQQTDNQCYVDCSVTGLHFCSFSTHAIHVYKIHKAHYNRASCTWRIGMAQGAGFYHCLVMISNGYIRC